MEYREFYIEQDKTGYAPEPFNFFEIDGEIAIGSGVSIDDCKRQIDELIIENQEMFNFKNWIKDKGWIYINPLKIYQHKHKEIYKTEHQLWEIFMSLNTQ